MLKIQYLHAELVLVLAWGMNKLLKNGWQDIVNAKM